MDAVTEASAGLRPFGSGKLRITVFQIVPWGNFPSKNGEQENRGNGCRRA